MIDTQNSLQYSLKKSNKKVVLFIKNAKLLNRTYKNLFYQDKRIDKVNIRRFNKDIRVYFWLNKNYKIKSFFLKPNKKYPNHRLVIDIIGKLQSSKKQQITKVNKVDKIMIVIDPGHGGEDPGALGKRSKEKNIVLKIAKKLATKINKNPKFRAVLSRKSDYFIKLSSRPILAQNKGAKAFISIHADSAIRKSANGSSVYILSKKGGTTKLAKKLEQSENATDIFGNEKISKDWALNTIMRDLARENKKTESFKLADSILNQLKKVGNLHKKTTQQANFVVLKTPAIPSVLVETAFISNPKEERRLRNNYEQEKIANAIYLGIVNYFK